MSRSGVFPPDSTFPQAPAGRAPSCDPPAVLVQTSSRSAAIPSGVPAIGVLEAHRVGSWIDARNGPLDEVRRPHRPVGEGDERDAEPDRDRPGRRVRSRLDAPDGAVHRARRPHRSVAHGNPREALGRNRNGLTDPARPGIDACHVRCVPNYPDAFRPCGDGVRELDRNTILDVIRPGVDTEDGGQVGLIAQTLPRYVASRLMGEVYACGVALWSYGSGTVVIRPYVWGRSGRHSTYTPGWRAQAPQRSRFRPRVSRPRRRDRSAGHPSRTSSRSCASSGRRG